MSTAVARGPEEMRFAERDGSSLPPTVLAGWLGAALLGAGYQAGQGEEPFRSWSLGLAVVGAAGVALGLWRSTKKAPAIRLGPAGVALEAGEELTLLPWYRVTSVELSGSALVLRSEREQLAIHLRTHASAAQRVLRELEERLGDRIPIDDAVVRAVKEAAGGHAAQPQQVPARRKQQVGVKCMATGQNITLERDVAACPRCAAPYHREHVPETCKVCGQDQLPAVITATRT